MAAPVLRSEGEAENEQPSSSVQADCIAEGAGLAVEQCPNGLGILTNIGAFKSR